MADPVVTITNGVPTAGTGTITTLGQTLLDGANATIGITTGAAVTTSVAGTLQGYLRGIVSLLVSGITVASHAVTNAGTFAVQITSTVSTAVTNAGTFAVQSTLQAGSALIGIVKIGDGTNTATVKAASTAPVTATDAAVVTVLRPDSAGIIATGSQASPAAAYLSSVVAGDIAAAATDSGNPVKIGGIGKTANPTAVTDGQRVNAIYDKLGKQIVVGAIRDLKGMQSTTITSSTTETTIVTAVASTFLDLYGLVITNTSATVTKVTIKDSTAGTTRAVYEIPATETRGFMLPVDSALPQAAVNTAWTATCGTSVASVEIAAYYVKNI